MKWKKITKFYKMVPECNQKPFICGHKTCKLWCDNYRVHMEHFWFIKWLVWEQDTVV